MKVKIKENSIFARIAALNFKSRATAITIGKTIHLHNIKQNDFLGDRRWLRHELEHIMQFKQYGFFRFVLMYFVELIKKGYHDNKWEIAARAAENDLAFIEDFELPSLV